MTCSYRTGFFAGKVVVLLVVMALPIVASATINCPWCGSTMEARPNNKVICLNEECDKRDIPYPLEALVLCTSTPKQLTNQSQSMTIPQAKETNRPPSSGSRKPPGRPQTT